MRVFLAGATGVIGRRLTPILIKRGHHVIAMTRRPDAAGPLRAMGAVPVVVDAFDGPALARTIAGNSPDVVMHQLTDLSAGDLAANAAVRVRGTRNLVDAAKTAGVRRIVAQSISWAYQPGAEPATEAEPLDLNAPEPRHTTVSGVAALEGAVREAAEWVILRYGALYGPGTWYARDGSMAGAARAGKLPAGAAISSFVHVDDAAEAAALSLEWPSGAVNICDDEPAAASAWTPVFCDAVGAPAPPVDSGERPGWARGASNARARREFGWNPIYPTWRDGFRLL
jgi:nucleoside-diphosphate-sugar epimerase